MSAVTIELGKKNSEYDKWLAIDLLEAVSLRLILLREILLYLDPTFAYRFVPLFILKGKKT